MRRDFLTYFDRFYLSRALALYQSLRRHHPSFRLFAFCMDDASADYLSAGNYPEIVVIRRAELEAHDPELAATRSSRTLVEYYFTSSPCCLKYALDKYPDIEILTYVDADLCFFSSSEPLYAELGDRAIAIVEHRFPPRFRHLEDRGRFNVGWLAFRNDEQGRACVSWWRERCIEWCFDRIEGDKFADQRYLDRFPELFDRLVIMQHKGVDVAPWNLPEARIERKNGQVLVDGEPLVCFHFQGLKHVAGPLYESGLFAFRVPLRSTLLDDVYAPYLAELEASERTLARAGLTAGHAKSQRYQKPGLRQRAGRAYAIARVLMTRSFLLARRA